ncbi:MAG: hypothetical protein K5987_01250 [Lachnospiraceae bacterium]|nr:hypothetical protein [Lachnospiraceae bacterium]
MVYYIGIKEKETLNALGKAPADINRICRHLGFKKIAVSAFPADRSFFYKKLWLVFSYIPMWISLLVKIKKDDKVLIQHPVHGVRIAVFAVPAIKRIKKCEFIVLIHDLESIRLGANGLSRSDKKRTDIADGQLLRMYDKLICHNEKMQIKLVEKGFNKSIIYTLGIFDYLTPFKPSVGNKGKNPSVVIAGNLQREKSEYIYRLISDNINTGLMVNLYGKGFDKEFESKYCIYHGSFIADDLPGRLSGDFGLVWDGTAIDTCTGNTGEYLRYNNPHKLSLYIAAGIPVIIWDKAAMADFVKENGIGITVSGLEDLYMIIKNISDERYREMSENAVLLSKRIRNGRYTRDVFKACGLLEI